MEKLERRSEIVLAKPKDRAMGAFQAVDSDPVGFGVVIPQVQFANFGSAQAGMLRDLVTATSP